MEKSLIKFIHMRMKKLLKKNNWKNSKVSKLKPQPSKPYFEINDEKECNFNSAQIIIWMVLSLKIFETRNNNNKKIIEFCSFVHKDINDLSNI